MLGPSKMLSSSIVTLLCTLNEPCCRGQSETSTDELIYRHTPSKSVSSRYGSYLFLLHAGVSKETFVCTCLSLTEAIRDISKINRWFLTFSHFDNKDLRLQRHREHVSLLADPTSSQVSGALWILGFHFIEVSLPHHVKVIHLGRSHFHTSSSNTITISPAISKWRQLASYG
jgi:hypothetical protein